MPYERSIGYRGLLEMCHHSKKKYWRCQEIIGEVWGSYNSLTLHGQMSGERETPCSVIDSENSVW